MNIRLLFILGLGWLLAGCSNAPIALDSSDLADCRQQFPWFCRGNSQAPEGNIHVNKKGKVTVSPYCVKAAEGKQIVFKLTPPGSNPLNSARVIAKNNAHTWLNARNNSDPDKITIDVPTDINDEEKYYYGVITNRGCVDPRIHVVN